MSVTTTLIAHSSECDLSIQKLVPLAHTHNDCNRVILYYQTFVGLSDVLKNSQYVTHIHLSAVHFGNNPDNSPYIHLNDHNPDDPIFDNVWTDMNEAHMKGIKIVLMIGGAGSAFTQLFSNYDVYFKILCDTIKQYPCICGVDLDVEEYVELTDIRRLIVDINDEFGTDFIIAMAPLGSSLMDDEPGMGGFSYKTLYKTPEGQRINYFNGQFYGGSFGINTYEEAINNGYPPNKVVMGMESWDYSPSTFSNALTTVRTLKSKYPDFGGVFDWEYFDTPPDTDDHSQWAVEMYKAIYPSKFNKNKPLLISNNSTNYKKLIYEYFFIICRKLRQVSPDWVRTYSE